MKVKYEKVVNKYFKSQKNIIVLIFNKDKTILYEYLKNKDRVYELKKITICKK